MRKILAIISALVLSAFVMFGQSQQSGNYDSGLSGDLTGGYPEIAASTDTTFILNWNFDTGMPKNVSEVGTVDIVVKPGGATTDSVLEVVVVGGGNDAITQSISDNAEYSAEWDIYITSADTSGWDNGEASFRHGFTLAESPWAVAFADIQYQSGTGLIWYLGYLDDASIKYPTASPNVLVADTWYRLRMQYKRATAIGANNGIFQFWVDGINVYSKTDIDNDAAHVFDRFVAGNGYSNILDAKGYIDNVKLWTPEGCP